MRSSCNFVVVGTKESTEHAINHEACKACKGRGCCQNCGCVCSPDDFYVLAHPFSHKERVRYIIQLLKRGDFSIDHKRMKNKDTGAFDVYSYTLHGIRVNKQKLLRGDGTLYIRARNIGKPIIDVVHFNWDEDTGCACWSKEKGCKFSDVKRPKGGRMLIPDPYGDYAFCVAEYDELDAARDWMKFQEVLYDVYDYFLKEEEIL